MTTSSTRRLSPPFDPRTGAIVSSILSTGSRSGTNFSGQWSSWLPVTARWVRGRKSWRRSMTARWGGGGRRLQGEDSTPPAGMCQVSIFGFQAPSSADLSLHLFRLLQLEGRRSRWRWPPYQEEASGGGLRVGGRGGATGRGGGANGNGGGQERQDPQEQGTPAFPSLLLLCAGIAWSSSAETGKGLHALQAL